MLHEIRLVHDRNGTSLLRFIRQYACPGKSNPLQHQLNRQGIGNHVIHRREMALADIARTDARLKVLEDCGLIVRKLAEVWNGDLAIKRALRDKTIRTHGNNQLALSMPDWLGICLYADVRPAQ